MPKSSKALFTATVLILPLFNVPARAHFQPPQLDTATRNQCRALALRVERSISVGAPVGLDRAVDLDAMIDRSLKGTELPAEVRHTFRARLSKDFSLGNEVCAALEIGGSYRFLHVLQRQGRPVLLFRLLAGGAINYHEMTVEKNDQGNLQITDIYVYLSGETMSETLRQGMLQMAAITPASRRDRLPKAVRDEMANMLKLQASQQLAAEGKFKLAIDAINRLPQALQNSKTVLIMRYQYAQKVDLQQYQAAVAAMVKAFPDDPFLDLILVESLTLAKKHTEVLDVLDRIDRRVGGDPYLDFLRAQKYLAMDKVDLAKAMAQKSIRAEPWLHEPYWLLVDIAIQQKDHRSTTKLLVAIERRLRVSISVENVEEAAAYAEFIKSTEFKNWAKPRRQTDE